MFNIVKANGEKEIFSKEKLIYSIERAEIPKKLQNDVLQKVLSKLYENITTREINNLIIEALEESQSPYISSKFGLKKAIIDLGPTGFPFEDFVSKIFQELGFQTKVRQILQGKCITHEIDVLGEMNQEKLMVEAKFHNALGIKTDVHVALYTKARFEDIKEKNNLNTVYLVTNTKMTSDAISYAQCVGMKIISWNYPAGASLRDFIDKFKLYPITLLQNLPQIFKEELLKKGIVLCRDICGNHEILDGLTIPEDKKQKIIAETAFVCQI